MRHKAKKLFTFFGKQKINKNIKEHIEYTACYWIQYYIFFFCLILFFILNKRDTNANVGEYYYETKPHD